uniref:Uncharacterized protein n=1 Tax=Clastoptera arizonana TaxID=38151 RepID=A0A1B6D632_9HEMI
MFFVVVLCLLIKAAVAQDLSFALPTMAPMIPSDTVRVDEPFGVYNNETSTPMSHINHTETTNSTAHGIGGEHTTGIHNSTMDYNTTMATHNATLEIHNATMEMQNTTMEFHPPTMELHNTTMGMNTTIPPTQVSTSNHTDSGNTTTPSPSVDPRSSATSASSFGLVLIISAIATTTLR